MDQDLDLEQRTLRLQPSGESAPEQEFLLTLRAMTPRAWVTPTLVGLNAGYFALMVALGGDLLSPDAKTLLAFGADYGVLTTKGEWWRLLASMFVHIGAIHLLLNMWALWSVGRFVERMLGNTGFLITYMASGLLGSLASVSLRPLTVSAGASGAIFGIFGALLGALVRESASFPAGFHKRLLKSTLTCVGFNIYYGLSSTGIDNTAHLGGLVAGFLCGLGLVQPIAASTPAARPRRNLSIGCCCCCRAGGFAVWSAGTSATFGF